MWRKMLCEASRNSALLSFRSRFRMVICYRILRWSNNLTEVIHFSWEYSLFKIGYDILSFLMSHDDFR